MESQLLKIIRENSGIIDIPRTFTEDQCPSAEMITEFDTWASYCSSKVYCKYKQERESIGKNYCLKELR